MTIEEIKAYMKENKINYTMLSKQSQRPIGTIKSILSGRTAHPRIDTMQAIEKALGFTNSFCDDKLTQNEKMLIGLYRKIPNEKLKELVTVFINGLLAGAGVKDYQKDLFNLLSK